MHASVGARADACDQGSATARAKRVRVAWPPVQSPVRAVFGMPPSPGSGRRATRWRTRVESSHLHRDDYVAYQAAG